MTHRIGIGYDIHRLKKGRPLWLGGVHLPFDMGLEGHSDADALLHAIIDALLGAAALPDIGTYFPPSDPSIKDISSHKMLAKALSEVRDKGFTIANIDTVVIAQVPKLSPYRDVMRATVAKLCGISKEQVQIKGKTNEGLDAVGKKQAIVAQAVVLLEASVRRPKSRS